MRHVFSVSIIVAALSIAFVPSLACDSKGAAPSGANATNAPASSGTTPGENGGGAPKPLYGDASIAGKIVLEGDAPSPTKITMTGDRFCAQHNQKHVAPKFEVGESGGLPHVFVYVKKGIDAKYPAPAEAADLDQSGCMYKPHIFGVLVGQPVKIKNSDDTAHNINSIVKRNDKFNISQPQKGMVEERKFTKQEVMVKFKCDVHGWMDAYCGVLDHPFFTVTDENGNFKIEKLPPGKYTIEAWHELYGTRTADVEAAAGESKPLDVTFKKRS